MKKYIPDVLTLSRVVLFIPFLIGFTLHEQYVMAAITYGIGLATNCLDGYLARRWNAFSKYGGSILQPVCDMAYASVAVLLLIEMRHWPGWIGILLIAIAGVLQSIDYLAGKRPEDRVIRMLKRHQSYLHPLYSVIVMTVAWWSFIFLAAGYTSDANRTMWSVLYTCSIAAAGLLSYPYVYQLIKPSSVRV